MAARLYQVCKPAEVAISGAVRNSFASELPAEHYAVRVHKMKKHFIFLTKEDRVEDGSVLFAGVRGEMPAA